MKRPLISDWHTAPEDERRQVRRLLVMLAALMIVDALLLWSLA